MASSSLSLLLLLPLFFSLSSAGSTTLTLSDSTHPKRGELLSDMAIAVATLPLNPRTRKGYTFVLGVGSPTQNMSFSLATAGGLTAMPCGFNFSCINCTTKPEEIQTFKPELSNSSAPVYCNNTVSNQIFSTDAYLIYSCANCGSNVSCSNGPAEFFADEGSVAVAGQIISDSITLSDVKVPNVMIGCMSESEGFPQGIGISAFGPVPSSLPSQLNLTKFSHCFISKKHGDNSNVSGSLVLNWGEADDDDDGKGTQDMQYTPFMKIGNGTWQKEIFYVSVEKIVVGEVEVQLSQPQILATNETGNGGLALEAGFTITYMDNRVFDPLMQELDDQVGKIYSRAMDVENETSLRPCYGFPNSTTIKELPRLSFVFEGGAIMVVPKENYMWRWNESVVCMAMWSDDNATEPLIGPAIYLGQWQMQNMKIEYDLAHSRLGFKQQNCTDGF